MKPKKYIYGRNNTKLLNIEIKGRWKDDAKKKFRLFEKLYPIININLIRRNQLQKIGII